MGNRTDLEKAVIKFYEFRSQPSLEAILQMFHPKGSFRISGTPKLGPFTQRVNMPETLPAAVAHLLDVWDLSKVKTVDLHIDGDTVLIHRAGTVTYIPTKTSFHTEFMDKVTFKDGLIIDFTEFVDTYDIAGVADIARGRS